MKRALRTWLVPVLVTLTVGGVLVWKHEALAKLEDQLAEERRRRGDVARAQAAGTRDGDEFRGSAVSAEEPTGEDEVSLTRLREEIAELKARAADRARKAAGSNAASSGDGVASITESMLPVAQWKNAGDATAVGTLETALWAAAGGDVETLSALLSMDPVVRTEASALLLQLPNSLRRDYDTAERLVALLAAADVPLGAAQIRDPESADPTSKRLVAVVRDTEDHTRTVRLNLRKEGERWRIVVPGTAIERYAAVLKGGSSDQRPDTEFPRTK